MWRRTALVCLMARTPPHLRDAGRPVNRAGHSADGRSGSHVAQTKMSTAAAPAASAGPQQPSSPNLAETGTTAETSSSSSVSPACFSSPLSPPPPPSSTSLSTLIHTVERLKEATRHTQHTLRSQDDALQLLQQKFALMQRHVSQLESTAEGLRGKLSDVHRVVGEIVMGQRNTDLLIQQMERQQLNLKNPPMSAPTQVRHDDVSAPRVGEGASASHTSASATSASSPASSADAQTSALSDPCVAHQVAALEARVNQLTVELFGADRLIAAGGFNAAQASPPAAENMAVILASSDTAAKRAAVMRALQQRHAVSLFTDAAGVTRVAGQCVRVHNVPLNMGATEVRELCVRHVCEGDGSGLVSCMVRRSSVVKANRDSSSSSSSSLNAVAGAAGSGAEAGTDAAPVYASQQRHSASPLSTTGGEALTTSTDVSSAAIVGALPRGAAVAALQPNTKAFEVVFASSALAVRALKVLNGLQLRPTLHTEPIPLAVEPVVSADVLNAFHELEASSHGAVHAK
ncbi:putative mitochondrial hypothetical protein [Leptomonas pyrrhocoris]|uniref:Uncharacterized protein n=1 Tax=Leptomonas pyrrhocoris TaxID=157538 RepID=A0A0M9FUG7_LEPPY|nr:putative mitochondrial hypothetical protein [Leptomonas pyrrhocoris]KPA76197.1 putative mitochondrial hypothetical protein [Leptomonas pyrrhocoris]|eukprot:XP_015654636.1 putative mitochondrial hypothetical protein [Leptomonas pyrrhocoris]